jgi:hypothetical protein
MKWSRTKCMLSLFAAFIIVLGVLAIYTGAKLWKKREEVRGQVRSILGVGRTYLPRQQSVVISGVRPPTTEEATEFQEKLDAILPNDGIIRTSANGLCNPSHWYNDVEPSSPACIVIHPPITP